MAKDLEKITLPPGVRMINDGFRAIKTPDGIGILLVNMDRAQAVRERFAERGIRVSYLHMIVKATALAACRVPEARCFLQRYSLYRPKSVDVRVSVSRKGNYAQVVVVKAAQKKSLSEIADTIHAESEKKRKNEDRDIRRLGWAYRILATRWLRRTIVRFVFGLFPVVRRYYGSVQVSTLNILDFFWPVRWNTAACIAMRKVAPRPMVVDGEVEAPLTAYITEGMNTGCWTG